MRAEVSIKQGDALVLNYQFNNDDGTPADLAAATVTSQVRDGQNNVVAILPVVPAATQGTFSVTATATAAWPLGVLRSDIKLLLGGLVVHSDTFAIRVRPAVTP